MVDQTQTGKSHISDAVRAELAKQPAEIRGGVLDVADADLHGPSVTPKAHEPPKVGR